MPNKTEKIEFDSGDLTPEEYAKLKAEMEKIAEGLDCEVFDPEKEPSKKKIQGSFDRKKELGYLEIGVQSNKAFLEMVSFVLGKLNE